MSIWSKIGNLISTLPLAALSVTKAGVSVLGSLVGVDTGINISEALKNPLLPDQSNNETPISQEELSGSVEMTSNVVWFIGILVIIYLFSRNKKRRK